MNSVGLWWNTNGLFWFFNSGDYHKMCDPNSQNIIPQNNSNDKLLGGALPRISWL